MYDSHARRVQVSRRRAEKHLSTRLLMNVRAAVLVEEKAGDVVVSVRVKPRSSRDRVLGIKDGELEVSVTAPPTDGKANTAVVLLLADVLGVGRRSIELVSGTTSRHKRFKVTGLSAAEVASKLGLG